MLKEMTMVPMGLAGTGVALGLAGEAFDSQGLTDAGDVAVDFIPPAIAIGAGGQIIKQLKQLDKQVKEETKEPKKLKKQGFLL